MDLISRQAAINTVLNIRQKCDTNDLDEYRDILVECFEELPIAEKRGKWMKTVTLYPYCSECDWMPEEDEMTHGFYRYCPNCGAKMDGGEE